MGGRANREGGNARAERVGRMAGSLWVGTEGKSGFHGDPAPAGRWLNTHGVPVADLISSLNELS